MLGGRDGKPQKTEGRAAALPQSHTSSSPQQLVWDCGIARKTCWTRTDSPSSASATRMFVSPMGLLGGPRPDCEFNLIGGMNILQQFLLSGRKTAFVRGYMDCWRLVRRGSCAVREEAEVAARLDRILVEQAGWKERRWGSSVWSWKDSCS